jgi:hypothetical protein
MRITSMRALSKGTIKIERNDIQKVGIDGAEAPRIKST